MEIDLTECTTKQFLGQLRQFAFILTGDEDTADAVLEETLSSARFHLGESIAFPCHRSWLFATLLKFLDNHGTPVAVQPAHSWWISLLEVPYDERTVLVLVDGYKFDLETSALIVGAPMETVQNILAQARVAFHKLTRRASPNLNAD